MYQPACDDEITGLRNYLAAQLEAIRAAAVGLTEEQAASQPCRSTLSVAGLITHVTYGMQGAIERLADPHHIPSLDADAYTRYQGSFALAEGQSCADALVAFDAAREAYLAAVGSADPDAAGTEPPSPWAGVYDARPANVRYYLVHQIEEMARHAGHADILREQLDGEAVPRIVLSQAGVAATDFFQPYEPAPGTIGA